MDSHESTFHSTKVRGRLGEISANWPGEIQRTSLSLILHVLNSSRLKSLQSSYYKPFAFVCVASITRLKWWLFCTRNDDAVSESLDDAGSVDGDSVTSESSSESSKSPDEAEKLSSGVPSAIDLSKPWVDISLLECEGPGLFMVRKGWRTLEIFRMLFTLYTVIFNSVKCRFDLMLFSSLQFQCLELLQQHEELEEKIQEYYTVCTQLE